jgi:plastocyanin
VLRRLLPATAGIALLAAACGQEAIVVRPAELPEPAFFTQVVDFTADVGTGLSMSTDADGNPHLAYLAFEEQAVEGEDAPEADPLAPTLPAVKHAHMVEDTWTRTSVAEEMDDLTPEDEAAIWVDEEGTHHIAWTQGGDLFYTDNPEGGAEAEPQPVTGGPVEGISIAAGQDGTPWISFYAEGQVAVASPSGKRWTVEPVAGANPGALATTDIGVAGRDPIVAYGDGGAAVIARRSGNQWTPETADQAGGLGISMALDADGNPHLAYYDETGAVKHAHDVGGGWEVGDVADAGGVPEAGAAAVVLDSQEIHHVAWQNADGTIGYANNEEGDFGEAQEVPRSEAGALPVLGVNAEDEPFLGWVDTEDTEVQLALRSDDEPLLALPSPQPTAAGGAEPAAECQPDGSDVSIVAPPGAVTDGFAEDCLAVPAGEPYTIAFDNQDQGQQHNVNVYTESGGESLLLPPFEGGIIGPDSTTYEGEPIDEPGSYFFQCDFHTGSMTGTFVVAEAGGGQGGQGGQGGGGGGNGG